MRCWPWTPRRGAVHELAVCQGLINEAERIARDEGASQVDNIVLSIGPLSGVEPPLLERAFEIARMGTMAENAELEIQSGAIVVKCRICGNSGEASSNRLREEARHLGATWAEDPAGNIDGQNVVVCQLRYDGRILPVEHDAPGVWDVPAACPTRTCQPR